MLGRLLFGLLEPVMARLAEGLKVRLIPEQPLITTMGLDVIANELAGVPFEPAAALPLAGV